MRAIKVLSQKITIEYVKEFQSPEPLLGLTDCTHGKVMLLKGMAADMENQTLIHELMHVIEGIQGFTLTEQTIDGLASGLLSVLKDNPDFVKRFVK